MAVIKMDWQKNLLIAGILATLLLLVIRWHEYQENLPAPVASSSQASSSIAADANVPAATGEIPVAANAQVSEADKAKQAQQNLISVKTDSLNVIINPLGGDIVEVA